MYKLQVNTNTNQEKQENGKSTDENDLVKFPLGSLVHVGEAHPICPFCGSTDTYQTSIGSLGNHWYYYYHCNSCGKNFAEYTENIFT